MYYTFVKRDNVEERYARLTKVLLIYTTSSYETAPRTTYFSRSPTATNTTTTCISN